MPSRISVMLTASRVAPSVRTTSRSRSWVIGRAGRTPCCSNAMAAASTAPIQMGRYRSPCVSLSRRIGWLPGSSTRTPTTLSSCTVSLPQLRRYGWNRCGATGAAPRRLVHRTPQSRAQDVPEARLEQGPVQLRRQRRELAELLRRTGAGVLRARAQHRDDELLHQPRLALGPGAEDEQGGAPRGGAGPGRPG